MISLKRLLPDTETEASLLQMVKRLLEGIAVHSLEGDPADHARFREIILQIKDQIDGDVSNSDLLTFSNSAFRALDVYNRRTAKYLNLRCTEFQSMVKMLTSTVSAIAETNEAVVRELQEIETLVESAVRTDYVSQLRGRLSECLAGIQFKTESQRTASAPAVPAEVANGLKSKIGGVLVNDTDPATGLPSRKSATDALSLACRGEEQAFVLALAVNRFEALQTRFSFEVAEEILRYFAGFMKRQLTSVDLLFRWTGPILIAILFRRASFARVHDEIGRGMNEEYEHIIQTPNRTIRVPISTRWTVFPMMASPRMVIQKIDTFGTFESAHDYGQAPSGAVIP